MNSRLLGLVLGVMDAFLLSSNLSAQSLVYVSRNGGNTAYCGVPLAGPKVSHPFSLPEATADTASVSDPGGLDFTASSASSTLNVTAADSVFTIEARGESSRGGLLGRGVYAVADARDDWRFTLDKPARFQLRTSLDAQCTEDGGATAAYVFGRFSSGEVILDPGTPAGSTGGSVNAHSALERTVRGRLLPGTYELSFNARADGIKYPYQGSFKVIVSLELGPDVPFIHSTRVVNGGLELKWTNLGTKKYVVESTDSIVNGTWSPVGGVLWPITETEVILPIPTSSTTFYRVTTE